DGTNSLNISRVQLILVTHLLAQATHGLKEHCLRPRARSLGGMVQERSWSALQEMPASSLSPVSSRSLAEACIVLLCMCARSWVCLERGEKSCQRERRG